MNPAPMVAAIIAAQAQAQKKAFIESLQKLSALSPASAVGLDVLRKISESNLSVLLNSGSVKRLHDGRLYFDRARHEQVQINEANNLKAALMALFVVVLILSGITFYLVNR